ncbi:MAG: DUF2726 domain-containing protein [Anaerolineales bacterium]|nr:DUF2726 domain-containing protein [Anaerolineales bacterium]
MLINYVGGQWVVLSKVRLADIFFVKRPYENKSYFGRISQKHVDFLLCDPKTMKPVVGIELDDGSHQQAKRKTRDAFVEQVFESAGLPLIQIPNQRAYSRADLSATGDAYCGAGRRNGTVPVLAPKADLQPTDAVPVCPKCGVPMVLRTAKQGKRPDSRFTAV